MSDSTSGHGLARRGPRLLIVAVVLVGAVGIWWARRPDVMHSPGPVPEPRPVVDPDPAPDSAAAFARDAGSDGRADGTPPLTASSILAAAEDSARRARALSPVDPALFDVGVASVGEDTRVAEPDSVRGIYVSAWSAGSRRRMAQLIRLADTTEINTFVVDVKDATGRVSYPSSIPFVRQIDGDGEVRIRDVRALLDSLRAHGIYPIARIVVFKDPHLAQQRPDWAIQRADGTIWRDHHDEVWVDPFNRDVWRYNIAIAREAIALGFAEVQWDYVRFPDVPREYMETAVFPARDGRIRADAIREFLTVSAERLADLNVPVTADVFGLTVSARDDMGIGQAWDRMVDVADVLLPMIYPSHFARGSYGIADPNASPYQTIRTAVRHARARTDSVPGGAEIRPWLQDFTLGEPAYGPAHVRAQIEAVYDAGLASWVLWNSSSRYTAEALAPEGGPPPDFPIPDPGLLIAVPDSLPLPDIDLAVPAAAAPGARATPAAGAPPPADSVIRPDTLPVPDTVPRPDTLAPPDTVRPGE